MHCRYFRIIHVMKREKAELFDQPGDPDKGGRLIVETIEKEDYPRTLVMGQDALNFVKGVYERKLKELEAWKETSVQSDYSFKR